MGWFDGKFHAEVTAKLMGERVGRFFADTRGLSVVCLRIGMAERPGGTTPGPETPQGLWGQQMWL